MLDLYKNYLNEQQVDYMKTHKYTTTGYSWLDKKFNPFWEKCAKALPYDLTPNKVTCLGGVALYSGVLLLAYYDLTFTKRIPDWAYVYFGICVFMGQTLDAIDGKHARNTKRFSPLGQLMDHGCDALTNSCHSIFIAQSFFFGNSFTSLILLQGFVHVSGLII